MLQRHIQYSCSCPQQLAMRTKHTMRTTVCMPSAVHAAVEAATALLYPDVLIAKHRLEHIKKLTPRIRQLSILISGRVSQVRLHEVP